MVPAIQNLAANQQFYMQLLGLQTMTGLFPSSAGPINPCMSPDDDSRYTAALEPYEFHESRPDRSLFWNNNANVGHKIHLNVQPQHVRRVSEYLQGEGFYHKYLRGGEIEDGKVFTVYLGAKDVADRYARRIGVDLGELLSRPSESNEGEIEYAPNVTGRFVGSLGIFHQYGWGLRGLTVHRKFPIPVRQWNEMPHSERDEVLFRSFLVAYSCAAQKYGVFFYGSAG